MLDTHAFEIVGEVLFRRAGNNHGRVLRCKIVRTRATASITELGAAVMISLISNDYQVCHFDRWFEGWSDKHNLYGDDLQSGRAIDVAVPVGVLEDMIDTGHSPSSRVIDLGENQRPFNSPVVAVRVDGRWEEPTLQD